MDNEDDRLQARIDHHADLLQAGFGVAHLAFKDQANVIGKRAAAHDSRGFPRRKNNPKAITDGIAINKTGVVIQLTSLPPEVRNTSPNPLKGG